MVFRLLENVFASQNIESKIFYSCPLAKTSLRLFINPQAERNYSFPPGNIFLKIYSLQQKGRRHETTSSMLSCLVTRQHREGAREKLQFANFGSKRRFRFPVINNDGEQFFYKSEMLPRYRNLFASSSSLLGRRDYKKLKKYENSKN